MWELVKKEYRLMRVSFLVMLVLIVVNFINLFLGLDYFGANLILMLTTALVIGSFYIFGAFSLFRDNLKLLLTNPRAICLQLGLKVVLAGIGAVIIFSLYVLSLLPTAIGNKLLYQISAGLGNIFLNQSSVDIFNQVAAMLLTVSFALNLAFIFILVWAIFKMLKRYVGFHAWWLSGIILYLLYFGVYRYAYFFSYGYIDNLPMDLVPWLMHAAFLIYSTILFTITCYITEKQLEI